MVLFTILAIIAILLIIFAVAVISVGGAVGIVLMSDIIVCIAIIAGIIWLIVRRKRK